MGPREEVRQQKAPDVGKREPKPKLQIVKLEQRIAPKLAVNHNETLVREPAKAGPKAAKPRKTNGRLTIVKLEERIAPKLAIGDPIPSNHNETFVRDSAKAPPKAAPAPRKGAKLRIVKLEERITPGENLNHNETLVRDRSANTR
jgi:hypothetical protein